MFTQRQINQLKAAARPRFLNSKENALFGKENLLLDEVINQIKEENPQSFLTRAELNKRIFFHKPKDALEPKYQVVYAGYITPYISDRI